MRRRIQIDERIVDFLIKNNIVSKPRRYHNFSKYINQLIREDMEEHRKNWRKANVPVFKTCKDLVDYTG